MKILLTVLALLLFIFIGCGKDEPVIQYPKVIEQEVGIDPTLTWTAVTTNCLGLPLSGILYNVYVVPGPGPMPQITTPPTEIPCGSRQLIDATLVVPVNSLPLSVTTYQVVLGEGQWTAAVESVSSTGSRGGFLSITFRVVDRPASTPDVRVGP